MNLTQRNSAAARIGSCSSRTSPHPRLALHRSSALHFRGSKQQVNNLPLVCSAAPENLNSVEEVTRDMSEQLTLANIRNSLIRQEDTIIFNLIERAQFARNEKVYVGGAISVPGFDKKGRRFSLLEYALRETEQLQGKLRRYTSPDEHAFYPDDLPPLVMMPIMYEPVLAPFSNEININSKVMDMYLQHVLPGIAADGDDNNYGSSSMFDVYCLQALSRRIHYGMFVAEAKFREKTEEYTRLIKAKDADGIMALLTDVAVEDRVVQRVALKAATFGQDVVEAPSKGPSNQGPKLKISPEVVAKLYREWVMPLTKEVEVLYLLRRLEAEPK